MWSRAGFFAVPVFLLAAFLLPVLAGLRRRRGRAADRLLTCHRLPLFLRGISSLLAATMLVIGLPFDTLAQESDLYSRLEAANWGRAGSVTQYAYDDNGSLVSKSVTGGGAPVVETYSYDLQGRLARHVLTETDGADETVASTAYRYDHQGIQVGKTTDVRVNGVAYPDLTENVNYLIDSANPTGYAQVIEELDGGGTLLKSYAIGDDVLLQSTRRSLGEGGPEFFDNSYLLYDGHGSTRQLADAQGYVTAQYTYDSYGVMLGQTAGAQQAQATSLLYSGERFDPTLQQYYLRARRYNQANGQFTSLDPYSGNRYDPQSLHKYAYCHTDPVNGVDPSGEMSLAQACFVVQWYAASFMIAHPIWSTALTIAVSMIFGEYFEGVPPGTPGPFDEMARIRLGMRRAVQSGLTSIQSVHCWRSIPTSRYKGNLANFFYPLYHVFEGRFNRLNAVVYASRFKSTVRAELSAYAKRGAGFSLAAKDNALASISLRGKVLDLTDARVLDALGVDASELVNPNFGGTSLTKTIGDAAAEMGFDILIAPSARHSGSNVVILNTRAVLSAKYAGKIDLSL